MVWQIFILAMTFQLSLSQVSKQLYSNAEILKHVKNSLLHNKTELSLKIFNLNDQMLYNLLDVINTDLDICNDEIISFDLSDNELVVLSKDMFKSFKNLQKLNLSNNKIEFIHYEAFSKLSKLKSLILSQNKLQTIPFKSLCLIPELTRLYLDKNRIRIIESQDFLNTSKILCLDLSYNELLTYTGCKSFKNLKELKILNMSKTNNPEPKCKRTRLWLGISDKVYYLPKENINPLNADEMLDISKLFE
jgi:hypothetical protein